MDIEISSMMTSGSEYSWTVNKDYSTRLTALKEDRMAYELTDEEVRRELSKQL